MTKSRRRRSSDETPEVVVLASHCCGTTRPCGPTASRTTWTHARSTTNPRRARSPVRGHGECYRRRLEIHASRVEQHRGLTAEPPLVRPWLGTLGASWRCGYPSASCRDVETPGLAMLDSQAGPACRLRLRH